MIYHKDIGFPSNYRRPVGSARLTYTRHARSQSEDRGIVIPGQIDFRYVDIVEVGLLNGRLDHLLVRIAYNQDSDLAMALKFDRGRWIVKTVWLNDINDSHRTLDRSKYATP